jgi:nitrate/nitrite transporter NarK
MESISNLGGKIVDKLGGVTLALVVLVGMALSAYVYISTQSTEPAPTPEASKTVELNNTGGTDATQTTGAITF